MEEALVGVTNSGRVWRKVPESDARSVGLGLPPPPPPHTHTHTAPHNGLACGEVKFCHPSMSSLHERLQRLQVMLAKVAVFGTELRSCVKVELAVMVMVK